MAGRRGWAVAVDTYGLKNIDLFLAALLFSSPEEITSPERMP